MNPGVEVQIRRRNWNLSRKWGKALNGSKGGIDWIGDGFGTGEAWAGVPKQTRLTDMDPKGAEGSTFGLWSFSGLDFFTFFGFVDETFQCFLTVRSGMELEARGRGVGVPEALDVEMD